MKLLTTLAQIIREDELHIPKPELTSGPDSTIANGLRLTFAIAGGIALIVIALAGFRFVIANGDPQSIAKAKNTIIYASLGLIICLVGYSIITFVINRV